MRNRPAILIAVLAAWVSTLGVSATPLAQQPAVVATTMIAYVRGGEDIRLIQPDGSDDHSIWKEPRADIDYLIQDLDWRPDGRAIAFASNHEEACSRFDSDIYAILSDGSGFRRVTNPPACAELANYPKGSVTVTVRNFTTNGPFFVYVQGAPSILPVVVPQAGASTVTFNTVADFGNVLQQAVVIEGLDRWIAPIAAADVKPGQTVNAGTIDVSGSGVRQFGARGPAWHRDGARLGYIFGDCAGMWLTSANPPAGASGDQLLQANSVFACVMDWGPTPALANEILYYSYLDDGIYRVTAGSTTAGTRLVETAGHELVFDVQWMPDGSGFLYTKTGNFLANANVYRYDFVTEQSTPLTNFSNTFARDVTISPDGQQIVFDRAATQDTLNSDLWIMNRNGSGQQRLVQDGRIPSWSQQAPQPPTRAYMPLLSR